MEATGAAPYRSMLFVGGTQLDTLEAALRSGADAICIDLEDAVPAASRPDARARAMRVLATLDATSIAVPIVVRINSIRTLAGLADLKAFLETPTCIHALVLPKVETGDELELAEALADDALSPLRFICIIETARGLERCASIAQGHPRLEALIFGGFDLSTALGAEYAWEPLLYARCRVVHAAAAASVQVLDSPSPRVDDDAALREQCARAFALGMTGTVAKQYAQIASINACFSASADEIRRAREIVAAFASAPARAVVFDGKLIELPTIKRLERTARLPLPDE